MCKKRCYAQGKQYRYGLICFILLVIAGIGIYYCHYFYIIIGYEKTEEKYLEKIHLQQDNDEADRQLQENIGHSRFLAWERESTEFPDNEMTSHADTGTVWKGDCILSIDAINLEKVVYNGSNRETHLNQYELVTATDDMSYNKGGNYVICGHASRLYGHSLNRLKEIKKGTAITITTRDRTDEYIVNEVLFENMNKTSKYCSQTHNPVLTIISCARFVSDESYIVIHAQLAKRSTLQRENE
ncbi:MAG: sortase [Clostridium sp.]|nr:sortase [Clostridium sp.]